MKQTRKRRQSKRKIHLLAPVKVAVFRNIERTIVRRLPQKGRIFPKKGDFVEPSAIVGVCQVSPGFRSFNLPEILDIPPSKVFPCLLKSSGSKVFKGDVIAESRKVFGIVSRQFVSPIDGIFELVNQEKGQVTIKFMPASFKLAAGVFGEVVKVIPDQEIHLKTRVNVIKGGLGSGFEREGILKIIASARESISSVNLDKEVLGSVIVGGALMSKEHIQKALALGARGIISGGINARDYKSLVSSLNPMEDVGISLLATEGYGFSEMSSVVYEVLEKHANRFVIIRPRDQELILPLLKSEYRSGKQRERFKSELKYLEKGDMVRLLTSPYLGRQGEVVEIRGKEVFPSGISAYAVLVQIHKGTQVLVPINNLEVLPWI